VNTSALSTVPNYKKLNVYGRAGASQKLSLYRAIAFVDNYLQATMIASKHLREYFLWEVTEISLKTLSRTKLFRNLFFHHIRINRSTDPILWFT